MSGGLMEGGEEKEGGLEEASGCGGRVEEGGQQIRGH